MSAFKAVFLFELNKFFKSKGYLITTIVIMVGVAIAVFFPRFKNVFAHGDTSPAERDVIWLTLSEDMMGSDENLTRDIYLRAFADAFRTDAVEQVNKSEEEIFREIKDGNITCAFVLTDVFSYIYYAGDVSLYDSNTSMADRAMQEAYTRSCLYEAGLSSSQVNSAMGSVITHETKSVGKDQRENFFYTYIMIMALYIVIVYYGQSIATGVGAEKSSRAMELLITSVKPVPMIFGKILASSVAGLIQLVCIFGTAMLSFRLNEPYWEGNAIIRSLFNVPASLLGYMLLFFLLGFFIYAFLYGATGSTVTKLEEVGQATMPVTLIFVVGFLVTVQAMSGDTINSFLVKVFSFIPFTSPMVMFARIAMSVVPAGEIAVSVAILIVSAVLVGVLSAKIYRAGVLIYGTRPKAGTLIKTVLLAK